MDLFNIYTSPNSFFTKIAEKPKWLIPLILVVVFSVLLSLVAITKTDWETQKTKVRELLEKRNVPPEQIEKIVAAINPKTGLVRGLIAVLIITPLGILIFTTILNLMIPLLGTSGSFKKTLAVTTNSALIRIPSAIVKVVLMLLKGSSDVTTSLILFFPKMSDKGFIYGLFSRIDFFTIWELFLVALGLKILFNIPGKKTYYTVFGIWLLYVIISSIFPTRFGG
ncbi:MAG: YIP1 family protein [candidate division WOR-3 bacterium]